jgi:hypothetical protein
LFISVVNLTDFDLAVQFDCMFQHKWRKGGQKLLIIWKNRNAPTVHQNPKENGADFSKLDEH